MTVTVPVFDAEPALERLFREYAQNGTPIPITFRDQVPDLPNGERATHFAHPYPAKLLRQIPYFFLNAGTLTQPGDLVLDPFCGSGTVLVEALLSGRNAVGADSNPLARLITRSKTSTVSTDVAGRRAGALLERVGKMSPGAASPDVVNIDHWFYPHVQRQLIALRAAIDHERNDAIKSFFRVSFSATIKRVSLADPRLSVPVRLRAAQYDAEHWLREKTEVRLRRLKRVNVVKEFANVLSNNIRRLGEFRQLRPRNVAAEVVSCDARDLQKTGCRGSISDGVIDIIITSPPYPGAQKYIRSSSLSLGWLGLATRDDLRPLEGANLGREHYRRDDYVTLLETGIAEADALLQDLRSADPLRAHIAAQYLVEMRSAIAEMFRTLRRGGHVVLVAGSNRIRGRSFATHAYLATMLEQVGFTIRLRLVDGIRSRGLMTKRNRTADLISHEWAIVARKP